MTGDDRTPDAERPEEEPEETRLDLAAILRSEKLLSAVSERDEPDDEEPLRLLAALAADVDDDAPDGVGDLGDLPGLPGLGDPETGTDAAGFRPGPVRRRWMAAVIGLAAAVVGTTGVAAAGAQVFAPIGGLFGKPSPPSSSVAGPERSDAQDHATPAPSSGGASPGPTTAGPAPSDPRATRFMPAEEAPGQQLAPPMKKQKRPAPSSPEATSRPPSPTPTGDGSARPSPSGDDPSANPSPSRHRWWPPKGLIRLGRDDDVTGSSRD